MKNSYFQSIENLDRDGALPISEVLAQLALNERGLIPVITQDVKSNAVLMFAWMNREALDQTLATRRMTQNTTFAATNVKRHGLFKPGELEVL